MLLEEQFRGQCPVPLMPLIPNCCHLRHQCFQAAAHRSSTKESEDRGIRRMAAVHLTASAPKYHAFLALYQIYYL